MRPQLNNDVNPSARAHSSPQGTDARAAGLPPVYNMGGTEVDGGTELIEYRARGSSNKFDVIRIPKLNSSVDGRVGFIDQISFSLRVDEVLYREIYSPYALEGFKWSPLDVVPRISSTLLDIFGFAVTGERDRGLHFYAQSFYLGDGDGYVHVGGQAGTVNVQIFGQGCSRAKAGWEKRLYDYMTVMGAWISRIDVAADLFRGQYTPDMAELDYLSGAMSLTNRLPFAERRGDWYNETGKTFYVGKRSSGKLLRVYEKAKQLLGKIALGSLPEDSPILPYLKWCRVEVEWHNKDREIPLDILLRPGVYLAGAYPALSFLSDVQSRIETIKKSVVATIERAKSVMTHQFGAWLYALVILCGDGVVNELKRDDIPKWAKPFLPLEAIDDGLNVTWEREMASVPF